MRIFDFNVHVPYKTEFLDNRLEEDLTMGFGEFIKGFAHHEPALRNAAEGMNLMLFNRRNTREDAGMELKDLTSELRKKHNQLLFTKLIDFRDNDVFDYLEYLQESGVAFIKYHSYQQKIAAGDFEQALKVSLYAEKLGLGICVDASFGTTGLYMYGNLELGAKICHHVRDVPVVLLHSGGARAMDAMLIADLVPNVYLETSLTIPFFERSRIWEDLAFSYKKLGAERILYASDTPYVDLEESVRAHTDFFQKYDFSSEEIDRILYQNTAELAQKFI